MLKLSVEAQLPLVAVQTRDQMNLHMVIKEITGKEPVTYKPQNTQITKRTVYTHTWSPKAPLPLFAVYETMVQAESTLVIVNPGPVVEPMFDAGEVPVPRTLMHKFMMQVLDNDKKATELLRGLGGCTIREAAEFARLTMARDQSLTLKGVVETRKTSFQGQDGLTLVDTEQTFYVAPPMLKTWLDHEKAFFLYSQDPRLIPRGLLFDGPPGVGKTAAAKYLAMMLGVPLFRFDVGGTKNKYVGNSEANMLANMQRIDNEEPAVVLLDEIEKVFGGISDHDSGTTTTMLSQLLWWLAERRSRTLVLMTTNNAKKLPKELYREGRIDEVMLFGGLTVTAAQAFAKDVLGTFKMNANKGMIASIVEDAMLASKIDTDPPTVSQAAITKAVYSYVKVTTKSSLPSG